MIRGGNPLLYSNPNQPHNCQDDHYISITGNARRYGVVLCIICHQCGRTFPTPVAWHTADYPGILLQKDTQL